MDEKPSSWACLLTLLATAQVLLLTYGQQVSVFLARWQPSTDPLRFVETYILRYWQASFFLPIRPPTQRDDLN